jgi:hypothetical protein
MTLFRPLALALALTASPVLAQVGNDMIDPYVQQLHGQGYDNITVGTTWLGRIVITAERDGLRREILLNRRTGEMLGDYAAEIVQAAPPDMTPTSDNDTSVGLATVGMPKPDDDGMTAAGDTRGGPLLDSGDAKDGATGGGPRTED